MKKILKGILEVICAPFMGFYIIGYLIILSFQEDKEDKKENE
jgi:hypothetical protein